MSLVTSNIFLHVCFGLGLIAISGCVAQMQRTETLPNAVLRFGLGGDFAAHGFGRTGFVIAEASRIPARWSLPTAQGFSVDMFFWWFFFPADPAVDRSLYLTGATALPGIEPRHSWWLQNRELGFRVVVPRCTQVTLYLFDAASSTNLFGAADVHFNRGEPDAYTVRIADATNGVYLTVNQTVGSSNITVEQVHDSSTAVGLLAGIFFDELPGCALAHPKTAAFTEHQSDATLLFGAGGNMSELAFGTQAYYLPPSDSAGAITGSASGYAMTFSTMSTGAYFHIPSDSRLAVPPVPSAPRVSRAMFGPNGGDFTITVTVPRCSLVRLYLVDLYNNIDAAEVRRPGKATVSVRNAINQGVWVTFRQDTSVAEYITNKVVGPNIPLLAVSVDEDPDCTAGFERSGQAILRYAAGGDFSAIGLGTRGYYLGGIIRYPDRASLQSGYRVHFPNDPLRAWGSPTVPPVSDEWKFLAAPNGGTPRADVWYGNSEVEVSITVPRCTAVTFYFLDWDSTVRRFLLRRDGQEALVSVERSFHDGVYATVTQASEDVTYTVVHTGGANAVLSGVVFDDVAASEASSCTFVPSPSPSPLPCDVSSNSIGTLNRGAGGDFRGQVGVGQRGWVLGYRWDVSLPSAGYGVTFVSPVSPGWTDAATAGYPTSRLLAPPGRAPWPTCWYAPSSFDVVVSVPRCTRVTFYFLDFDSTARRFALQQDGRTVVDYTCSFEEGVYVTVPQTTASAEYSVHRTGGANAVLSGVMFDDVESAECVLASASAGGTPTDSSSSTEESETGPTTVVIAVVLGVAAVAIVITIVLTIALVARSRNVTNFDASDGNAPPALAGPQEAPVVGHVVAGVEAPQPSYPQTAPSAGVVQYPQQAPYTYPPQQPQQQAYPSQPYPSLPSQTAYGYPPQPRAADCAGTTKSTQRE